MKLNIISILLLMFISINGLAKPVRSFQGHTGPINMVAFAADSRSFISGSDDKTIKLWQVSNARAVRTFKGHKGTVTSVMFMPNGEHFISTSADKTLKLWNISSGTELNSIKIGRITSTLLLPDANLILFGKIDGVISLWNVSEAKKMCQFKRHKGAIYSMAYSHAYNMIISASKDKTIKLWSLGTCTEIATLKQHNKAINSIRLSPDSRYIISGSDDKTLKVWNLYTRKAIKSFTHNTVIKSVAFSPTSEHVISAGGDYLRGQKDFGIKLWDIESGALVKTFEAHTKDVNSVIFSPDGNYILSASSDKSLKLWRNNLADSQIEIKFNPTEGIAPLDVELTASSADIGSITSYQWFLNNHKIADGNPAHYVFKTGGKHLIKLIATDTEGLEYESTAYVTVKSPPIAKAIANPSTGKAPLVVKLDASQSIDYDGKIVKYEWLLNNEETIIGKEADRIFNTIGEYKITLTVTDNDELTASDEITVTVTENYTLTIKKDGEKDGGIVEAKGINCGNDCSEDYISNTEVTLIAAPNDGFSFKEWKGSCSGSDNTCKLKITSNQEVTAIFEKKPEGVQGQAIIIAGGGGKASNTLFPYTHEFTQRMYQILNERGFTDIDIQYLSPLAADIDMDGHPDEELDDYKLFDPKKEIAEAFTKAAAKLTEGQQFVFYIHSHANQNELIIDDKTTLSALELKDLLAKIPTKVQQIIFIDSCYSGSFFDELAGVKERILISSADDKNLAWSTEYASFSDRLLRAIQRGENLFGAFKFAEDMIQRNKDIFKNQKPWLDDDGDGIYTARDKAIAKATYIGKQGVHAAKPPEITQVHPHIRLEKNHTEATLWVKIREDHKDIYKVRAILRNPNQEKHDYNGVNTNFGREAIKLFYNPAKQRYEYVYKNFSIKGIWKIIYQAQSKTNIWSDIKVGEVEAEGRTLAVTVKMLLNQSSYTIKDAVHVDMRIDGKSLIDLYVALIFPNGSFVTIKYPLEFSLPKSIQAYKKNVNITKQQTFPIMRIPMPEGISKGDYQFCGVLVKAEFDANKPENWIHYDCEGFKLKGK